MEVVNELLYLSGDNERLEVGVFKWNMAIVSGSRFHKTL